MNEQDALAFADLFKEVYHKCFGNALNKALSEPESKHLSNEIEDQTGLVIGWKSIKNYAAFVLKEAPDKRVNPSIATLDTLARYVYEAPKTSENQRKKNEGHFPYWFRYKEPYTNVAPGTVQTRSKKLVLILGGLILLILILFTILYFINPKQSNITEDFHSLDENYFKDRHWFLVSEDIDYWNRRIEKPGKLTLFTLEGDNWPKTGEAPVIRNLLTRKIYDDCFSAEVHFSDFIPQQNWQQAGILLLEDTSYQGKSIRLSLSYNDFFGGYNKPGEIIIQGIASYGKAYSNLEEFIHQTLFTLDEGSNHHIIVDNLRNSALRVEKQGSKFRFLYSASPSENFSFKELAVYKFDIDVKYIGIFALKGFVGSTAIMPVNVDFFRLENLSCK
ncbi:MAG: hypothetical protein SFU99_13515 [Saprospiraceae bacterium]|nr:hypothetical protein [Saprospiraceae bacterium]